ncbi:phage BR0599 family protein [Halomonas stenophila]|uniref:Putative phage protein (TIGR02218 family) n=1 Tax=Halomonas stenophila TaxID=795312 RepID=A0A7W5EUL7_9GAMM|nr:phage BR0599 family protein [Halomonas stenophila]MBB3231698.1 putative phage protein (TIGR02218 family) [Halomonas stenophila]
MTTETIELSDALGEPIELYRFSYGPGVGTILAYTDADFAITHDTITYQPVAGLDREPIVASQSLDRSDMEIEIDEQAEIAQLFLVYPPSDVVGLTIFRCHWDAEAGAITTPMAVWIGSILSCKRSGYLAALHGESVDTSLRRTGLRWHWQYMCPHVLYGPQCQADRNAHSITVGVTSVDPRTITVSGLIEDQYRGGVVSWQPLGLPLEQRTVLGIVQNAQAGTSTLTLAGAPRHLEPSESVELAKGCRHTLGDCRDIFANAPRYGGMPYIPLDNPHGTTRIYN